MAIHHFLSILSQRFINIVIFFAVFVFWAFFYPGHILMKEQFSFFLYTQEFWKQYVFQPGGWSVYCGNFLAQFYINQWMGALIQTLLCAALMILLKRILKKMGVSGNLLLVAVFPALLLLTLQCDYCFTPGNTLVLLSPFALTLLYMNMKRVMLRRLVFTLAMLPVYLFSGAAATCCLYVVCIIFEWFVAKDRWKYTTTAWIVFAILLPHLWQIIYLTPNDKLYQIVDYTLDKNINYILIVLLAWLPFCILTVLLVHSQRLTSIASGKFPALVIMILLTSCGFIFFPQTYRHTEELNFRMYLAVTQNEWDKALKTGTRVKTPDQCSAWLINLSLAIKGELPQKMFNYKQTDEHGLIPVRERKRLNVLYGSAFYYHIGMLNEAIRWVYDLYILNKRGMDYHTLTRLAVWNKENGYEQVAAKYFDILNHTLMYRSFAKRECDLSVATRVATAEQVEFFVNEREPLYVITRLFENNKKNPMILDYMLCYQLLKNDLNNFLQIYETDYPTPKELPKAYQEALLEIPMLEMVNFRRYPINQINISRHRSFYELAKKGNNNELEKQFGDTWWNYSFQKKKSVQSKKK